jgi:histone acetyltransferase HTATIP
MRLTNGSTAGSRAVVSFCLGDMEWPRPKAPGQPKKLAGAALKAQQRLQVQKGKGMGMGKGKGVSSRGKTPRPAGQSLLKKASVNAARAASSKAPTDMLGTGMLGPDSPPYTFEIGSPTASLDLPFMLKRKRSNGEDTDPDADGSVMDLEDDADAEGSLDVSVQGDHDQDQDMDIDADADGSEDEQDPDHDDEHEPSFDLGSTESGAVPPPPPLATFSKEAEIEKLRTSGSMTQSVSEVARVKNLNRLQIGAHEVDAWYFSPYPREYAHLPVLYICEFCLFYFPTQFMLGRHRKRCKLLHPPGNEIYRHEDISFYELDGKRQLQYCRNLSLLSKCFLDQFVASLFCDGILTGYPSKTLYYDVTPFLYYVMVRPLPSVDCLLLDITNSVNGTRLALI